MNSPAGNVINSLTYAEIATRALSILEQDGWNRGYLVLRPLFNYENPEHKTGSHCIGGAINLAANPLLNGWAWYSSPGMAWFYQHVVTTIRRLHPDYAWPEATAEKGPHYYIAKWNNDPITTYADVRAVLTAIAAEVPVTV